MIKAIQNYSFLGCDAFRWNIKLKIFFLLFFRISFFLFARAPAETSNEEAEERRSQKKGRRRSDEEIAARGS
jgi:hypothetical protein